MDILSWFVDFIIHLDRHLGQLIQEFGAWTYIILFLIIFCETGLVIMPFLPGDSLLFTAGAFAATGSFNVFWLFIVLTVASIIGDTVNYWAGKYVGPNLKWEGRRLINKEYLERTERFYERHGGKTIILARFVPIIRTFAPFVAGIGSMRYPVFLTYNLVGGILWNAIFIFAGYFFGNMPVVRDNFTLVIFAIIFVSLIPPFMEFMNHRKAKRP
ncbi:MAG: DedA family protein [Candidatus Altiarchaeota archaeon]